MPFVARQLKDKWIIALLLSIDCHLMRDYLYSRVVVDKRNSRLVMATKEHLMASLSRVVILELNSCCS